MDPDRRRGGIGARQIDRNGGPASDLALDADLAARLVGEAENLAEAEAGALAHRLGGEERLERAVEHFGRHPAAGVGDADPDIVAGADVADLVGGEGHVLGRDAHQAAAVHRIAGVDREVEDRVLELVGIDIGRPGVGARGRLRSG